MRVALALALTLAAGCKAKAGDAAAVGSPAVDTAAVSTAAVDTAAVDTAVAPAAAPSTAALPTAVAPTAPIRDAYHAAPRDTISREAYDGWKQYELNCSRCHGEYAVGSSFAPSLAVSLRQDGTVPTQEVFVTVVCQGRKEKGMPSWCELGLEMSKIQGIYTYLKGRADGKIGVGRPAVRES